MKEILALMAKQIVIGKELAGLYALRAQQIAGQHASMHQRDYHQGHYDVDFALKYERELQEKIGDKSTEFEKNQEELLKLMKEPNLAPA